MSNYIIYNGELYHHGVKGMRWGHRKPQEISSGSSNIGGAKTKPYSTKAEKKQFKADVKYFHKNRRNTETWKSFINEKRTEKGKDYADQIIKESRKRKTRKIVGGVAGGIAAAAVLNMGKTYIFGKVLDFYN